MTRAIFISWGTTPQLRDKLIIYVNGAQIKLIGPLNNIHWNTIVSWSSTRSKATTNLRDFLFWCRLKKRWINKASIQKRRWDLSEAGIDLAKSGPIFVKYSRKRLAIRIGLNISSPLDLKKDGNLHLLFFLLIRSLSNFQVNFALDLYSHNFFLTLWS